MKDQENNLSEENGKRKQLVEIVIILVFGIAVYAFSATFDILEKIVKFSWENESLEIDELLTVSFFLSIALLIFWIRRWKDLKRLLNTYCRHERQRYGHRGIVWCFLEILAYNRTILYSPCLQMI